MSAHAVCSTCVEAPAVVVRVDNATSTTSCACRTCDTRASQKRGRQTTTRVALRPPSSSANDQLACDVCQMNPAYVICHEDRAFLCRVCDVSIHDANPQAKSHQRFLFGNTRVDLEAMGAGEEVGRRMSPSDSAAEHARVPDYEEEETKRPTKRQSNRRQKALIEDGAVPSMNEVAPGVFENFMTGLLGEEEGKKVLSKSSADETDFWGDIFSENWAAMESGMLSDDYTVPDFDQQVPNAMF